MLLEQQILADLAVEELDRVHGQVEPLALADVGLAQLGVGLDDPPVGGGEGVVGPFQLAVGPGLDARDGTQPDERHQQGGAGGRHSGAVSRQPPHQLAVPRLSPGDDRLVGRPPLEVLGQHRQEA